MNFKGKTNIIGKILRATLCMLLCAVLVTPSVLPTKADQKSNFNIEADYGFDGKVEVGCYIPINISIENLGDNFEGRVQLIVPSDVYNDKGPTMYEKDLSIVRGTTKTISMTIFADDSLKSINVRLVNKKEKVLTNKYFSLNTLSIINSVNIGVLSDDFSALSYFNRFPVMINSSTITVNSQIIELTADSISDDYRALDMIDVILISNYSTDKLSATQLTAIDTWVKGGGTLLIGSGSTFTKVMSGLKDLPSCAGIKTNSSVTYETRKTTYGLSICDPDLLKVTDYFQGYNGNSWMLSNFLTLNNNVQEDFYSRLKQHLNSDSSYKSLYVYSYEFEKMASDFFDKNEDFFRMNFSSAFLGYYPSDDAWNDYEKYSLSKEMVELVRTLYDSVVSSTEEPAQQTANYPYLTADFANVTIPVCEVSLKGDDRFTNETFPLVKRYSYGSGIVAVAAMDFTQNPLISYVNKADVAKLVLKSTLPNSFYSNLVQYPRTTTGTFSTLLEKGNVFNSIYRQLQSATIPPLLLYTFIILIYLVGIFVSYIVLKKKKKTILFWMTQAIAAVGFSLLILLFSISTRLYRAELRTASFNYHLPNETKTTEVASLIMPKKKTYTLELTNSYNTERYHSYDPYYYRRGSSSQSLDDYYFSIRNKADSTEYRFKNTAPLASESFISEHSTYNENSGFDLKYDTSTQTITVTNNTGSNLEKAYVVIFDAFYPLNDFQAGETKELNMNSTAYMYPNQVDQYLSYAITGNFVRQKNPIYTYLLGNNSISFKELFIGSDNAKYIDRRMPLALYEIVINSYWNPNSKDCIVGGYAKNPVKSELQAEAKAKALDFEYHIQCFTVDVIKDVVMPLENDPMDNIIYTNYYIY